VCGERSQLASTSGAFSVRARRRPAWSAAPGDAATPPLARSIRGCRTVWSGSRRHRFPGRAPCRLRCLSRSASGWASRRWRRPAGLRGIASRRRCRGASRRGSADRRESCARDRARGLHLALRSGRSLLAVHSGGHASELSSRRAGSRFWRQSLVHDDLSGVLCGPLAAHPFRGLSDPGERVERANKSATSQIALPKATCDEVYATAGYESDMVFSDGASLELATMTGIGSAGCGASLTVAV
jgi:hypothetical protein